jgi:hypothetical protein
MFNIRVAALTPSISTLGLETSIVLSPARYASTASLSRFSDSLELRRKSKIDRTKATTARTASARSFRFPVFGASRGRSLDRGDNDGGTIWIREADVVERVCCRFHARRSIRIPSIHSTLR